ARGRRGHRHARVDHQPGDDQQVRRDPAGPVRAEVLLPQRYRVRRRGDGVLRLRQEDDPGPARQRGSRQAAVRPGGRPDPQGPGPHDRPAHRGEVPRGARHPAVPPAAPGAQAAVTEPREAPDRGGGEEPRAMQLIPGGGGGGLTREFKDAVPDKVAKLAPLLPALVEARATFTAEKFRRTVRLTLTARRHVFSTTATAGDLTAAVDG